MRAVQLRRFGGPEVLEIVDLPVPVPGSGQVLVRVSACAVCRTDLHVVDGDLPQRRSPIIPGHEVVGVVEALGPRAKGVKVGQKRIVYPWIGCGKCAVCKKGEELLCLTPRTLGTRTGSSRAS